MNTQAAGGDITGAAGGRVSALGVKSTSLALILPYPARAAPFAALREGRENLENTMIFDGPIVKNDPKTKEEVRENYKEKQEEKEKEPDHE